MNSQSNNFGHEKHGCCDPDDHHRHRSEAGDAILRATVGSFGPSNFTFAAASGITLNQPIASVTIDTGSLDDPTILVQFNGILTATAAAAAGLTYNFTLFRNCRNSGFREQLRSFNVSQAHIGAATPDSRGLSFAYGESCSEGCFHCCTYTLELTSIASNIAAVISVTVAGTLSVLAVGEEEE